MISRRQSLRLALALSASGAPLATCGKKDAAAPATSAAKTTKSTQAHPSLALGVEDLADERFDLLPIVIALDVHAFAGVIDLPLAHLGGVEVSLGLSGQVNEANHDCDGSQDQSVLCLNFHVN